MLKVTQLTTCEIVLQILTTSFLVQEMSRHSEFALYSLSSAQPFVKLSFCVRQLISRLLKHLRQQPPLSSVLTYLRVPNETTQDRKQHTDLHADFFPPNFFKVLRMKQFSEKTNRSAEVLLTHSLTLCGGASSQDIRKTLAISFADKPSLKSYNV